MGRRKPRFLKEDPFVDREREKYGEPVPSREFIVSCLEKFGKPTDFDKLCERMGLVEEYEQRAFKRRLRAMEREGDLIFNRAKQYGLTTKMDLVPGRVFVSANGDPLILSDDGSECYRMTPSQRITLFHDDHVLVHVAKKEKGQYKEAFVSEIIERAGQSIVGKFFWRHDYGVVQSFNRKKVREVIVEQLPDTPLDEGDVVEVRLIDGEWRRGEMLGEIQRVLAKAFRPGDELDFAILSHGIPFEWPESLNADVVKFGTEVPSTWEETRVDLRDLPFVTIDGEDAKDFDDAVYCENDGRGFRLIVAIADVSYYVEPGSALDREAYQRGNSVYFPGRVIPMLPEVLSNGLCSLKPNVDRFALVCDMQISSAGNLTKAKFYEAVIHSHARLTYTEVGKLFEQKPNRITDENPELVPHIQRLHSLYLILHQRRASRGAIDFNTVETKVIFGEDNQIADIVPVKRNDAHRTIEECMLMANVATAKFCKKAKANILYRVHEAPAEQRVDDLRTFLTGFGLKLPGATVPTPQDYSALLTQIQGRDDRHVIETVLLRSLSQAVYSPKNNGHFGLAYGAYTHFTSPIRRYPDLLTHRAIKIILREQAKQGFLKRGIKFGRPFDQFAVMTALGEHASFTERRADEATRDAMNWLKARYIANHVGEVFEGIISSVTSFGLFVELMDIYVDGLVHISQLEQDYFHYDATHHRLVGEATHTVYQLGDKVTVRVDKVDIEERKIDFGLVSTHGGKKAATGKKRRKKKK